MEEVEEVVAGSFQFPHERMGPRITESSTFTSTFTRKIYKMRHRLTCKSSFVIYLVTCRKSRDQMGGGECVEHGSAAETVALRHAAHRMDSKETSTSADMVRLGVQIEVQVQVEPKKMFKKCFN